MVTMSKVTMRMRGTRFAVLAVFALSTFFVTAWMHFRATHANPPALVAHARLPVRGAPTQSFRDNLLRDAKYITSWISAGWTNDVITYMNLIYLALITERVPIIPMFLPAPPHMPDTVPPIDFGEVFDVPRLSRALGVPVLEWHQVKDRNSTVLDGVGCWNVWAVVQDREDFPRRSLAPLHLKLDISYTKVPSWAKLVSDFAPDLHSTFWALATVAFRQKRNEHLSKMNNGKATMPSPKHGLLLPPDEQLLCYDYLYYVCASQPFDFDFDYSPVWRFVGRHMHWSPKLQLLRDETVRHTLNAPPYGDIPNWITVHVRRGDFANNCRGGVLEGCFASLSVIARRVKEVQAELWASRGLRVDSVIMTSNEMDPKWWEEVAERGWYRIDHERTTALYGSWYPVFIDAAIQGGGVGFVGTDRSTMSALARLRVETWKGGVMRTFKWGKVGADDH